MTTSSFPRISARTALTGIVLGSLVLGLVLIINEFNQGYIHKYVPKPQQCDGRLGIGYPAACVEAFSSANPTSATLTLLNFNTASNDSKQLDAAVVTYKQYVKDNINQLVLKNEKFTQAIIGGNLAEAQTLYAPTRIYWKRVEPMIKLLPIGYPVALISSMNAREDNFARRTDDPGFTGFHRLEVALFRDKTTDGMKAIAVKLLDDSYNLQKQITDLAIEPEDMVDGAVVLLEDAAATNIPGRENHYSRTDLWDFNASIEGLEKILELLRPLLQQTNPSLLMQTDLNLAKINAVLAKYKTADGGFASYDSVTESDKTLLKSVAAAAAEDLANLRGTLGIN